MRLRVKINRLKILNNIEFYCIECIEANNNDMNALFILLFATLQGGKEFIESQFEPKYASEDLAVYIKELDSYKGYLAWVQIYLSKSNTKFATEVLEELIQFHPEHPEAYFNLLQILPKTSDEAFEIAESMFLNCTSFHTLETK